MANKTSKKTEKVSKPEPFLEPDYDTVILDEIVGNEDGLFTLKEGSNIWIPNAAAIEEEDGLRSGYIVAIGPSSNPNRPFLHSKGDLVTFGAYTGRTVKIKETEYVVIRHLDILFRTVNA
jgi:co-chaperonin GroES (HSP10)